MGSLLAESIFLGERASEVWPLLRPQSFCCWHSFCWRFPWLQVSRKHKGQGPRTHEVTYVSPSPQLRQAASAFFRILTQASSVLRVRLLRPQETGTSFLSSWNAKDSLKVVWN